ncbi:hypothetical protein HYX70_03895 [Candidatus Saccharibacteria bacterium]|nr:hypothetical protein [Candidatus Saccharibacteria bacterium]
MNFTLFTQPIQDQINAGNWQGAVAGLLNNAVVILLFIVGVVSVIFIIIAGFMYVTSGGDERRLLFAKRALAASVGGLVAAMAVGSILNFIFSKFF